MKIISFNLRDWTRDTKKNLPTYWKTRYDAIARMIANENPDILCVQECLPPIVGRIKKLGYKKAGCGVSHIIFVKNGIKSGRPNFSLFCDWCEVGGIRIINIHSRWEQKVAKKVIDNISKLAAGKKAVVCGDFNITHEKAMELGLGLTHVRTELGLPIEDTFQNFTKQSSHGEIDHFYVNQIKPESFRIIKDNYGCERMSDHYPICLTF